LDFYKNNKYKILDKQLIHGDSHLRNFLFKDNKAIKLIDYDSLGIDTPYVDLSLTLFYCCFFNKKGMIQQCDFHLFNFLLKKYEKNVEFKLDYILIYIYVIATILQREKSSNLRFNIVGHFISHISR
jgi:thiamine kinase-like enzyme